MGGWLDRARGLLRREGHTTRDVALAVHHAGYAFIEYRARMPGAGNVLGIRFPAHYPRSALLGDLYWFGGRSVVVPTTNGGAIPANVLRKMKFWCAGQEVLCVRIGFDPSVRTHALTGAHVPKPTAMWVKAPQSGRERVVSWAQ